jgi:hypothetical protein
VENKSRIADRVGRPKATPREWTGLAVLALPCLLYSMDLTVLNLKLHVEAGHTAREAHLIPAIELLKQQKNHGFRSSTIRARRPSISFSMCDPLVNLNYCALRSNTASA